MSDETDGVPAGDRGDDPLEVGMRAAFGPDSTAPDRAGESVLAAIERDFGISSHLRLRDGPDERAEPVGPGTAGPGSGRMGTGRYQIAGEIARGGVGVVLKGRDADLGREVAIKTLRAEYAASPAMVRRLVEEAQIGGQLQHPGVLPVYEMGLDASRRPYFTMKLVRGRTLAALLHDRADPAQERRRFLMIFEQVCQTVAYAHARGVVHRDLKPSNVMVGAFGEVQVVDWGLAKVLDRAEVADVPTAGDRHTPAGEIEIATVRSGTPGTHSQAGSVLGTPAYMAPEQARGEVEDLDERCDVFALGAILFEILTGRPPYLGTSPEVLRQAAEGRLEDAFGRLEACGAEGDLVRIARTCLSIEREGRCRDAGIVARDVGAYLASAEERARRAELEAAMVRARAVAERRARRLSAALGVLAFLAVVVGGGAYLQVERQRAQVERQRAQAEQQRVARLQAALALIASLDVKGRWLLTQAGTAPAHDAGRWAEALALTRQAVEQALAFEADEATRRRSRALAAELGAAEDAARKRAARVSTAAPEDDGAGQHRTGPR
ncbi:MAG: eukaryotic-like serine/threonine-protein kinase [Chloroflexota bacterium]|nr:eukaryotic-like serine/threonine-protein kinase [Chloroflexota bacterium]